MERIGDRLRKRREELGFTINDMARVTRFRPETIMAVEEGRVGIFPAEAYLKAFLRAYANRLGLDADEIVREQKSEEERIRDAIKGIRVHPRRDLNLRKILPWLAAVAAIVIVAAILFGRFLGDRGLPGVVTETPVERVAVIADSLETGTEPESIPAEPVTRVEESVVEDTEPVVKDAVPDETAAVSAFGPLSKLEVAVSGWPIRARLRSGDSVLVEGWLRPGYADTFYCAQPFVIDYLTDRDAVSLTLDGNPVELPMSRDKQISGFEIGSGQ
jgi:cytoskeletal protein RodZ